LQYFYKVGLNIRLKFRWVGQLLGKFLVIFCFRSFACKNQLNFIAVFAFGNRIDKNILAFFDRVSANHSYYDFAFIFLRFFAFYRQKIFVYSVTYYMQLVFIVVCNQFVSDKFAWAQAWLQICCCQDRYCK